LYRRKAKPAKISRGNRRLWTTLVECAWAASKKKNCFLNDRFWRLAARGKNRKPELLATAPNQLWSWDITELRGPGKWSFYYLYVILDVLSLYVTGWMLAYRETAGLARQLIEHSCLKQKITPGQPTIHADRGSSMTSKSLALMFADLGVVKTHGHPHVSDDNPFSEAHFKTLKYRPNYPDRFGSIQDARLFCQEFFPWYNQQHAGLNLLTPADVHSWSSNPTHLETASRSRSRLSGPPRTVHPPTSAASFLAKCRLD
jgi:transposase InsO family protein